MRGQEFQQNRTNLYGLYMPNENYGRNFKKLELHVGKLKIAPLGDGYGLEISDSSARPDGGNCITIGKFGCKRVDAQGAWRYRGRSNAQSWCCALCLGAVD